MTTITNRVEVDRLIAAKGRYLDDPRIVKIVEYKNAFDGGPAYGLIYEGMDLDYYRASPYVREPRTLWSLK